MTFRWKDYRAKGKTRHKCKRPGSMSAGNAVRSAYSPGTNPAPVRYRENTSTPTGSQGGGGRAIAVTDDDLHRVQPVQALYLMVRWQTQPWRVTAVLGLDPQLAPVWSQTVRWVWPSASAILATGGPCRKIDSGLREACGRGASARQTGSATPRQIPESCAKGCQNFVPGHGLFRPASCR